MDATRMEILRLQMERLRTYITTGKYWEGANESEKKRIRNQSKRFILENDSLFYVGVDGQKREVVTNLERVKEIIDNFHSISGRHSGIDATVNKITTWYWWGSIKDDVIHFIKSCTICQKQKKGNEKPKRIRKQGFVIRPVKVKEPLELVVMDLMGPLQQTAKGKTHILTLVDYFTKFIEVSALKSNNPEEVCRKIRSFIYRYGAPKQLVSYTGRDFVNEVNDQLYKMMKIKCGVSYAFHPQSNGLVKSMNRTVKTRLSKVTTQHRCDWDEVLQDVAFSIRCQKQASTKYTPFFLMYGRHPRYPFQMEEAADVVIQPNSDEEPETDEESEVPAVSAVEESEIDTDEEAITNRM